jgi:subtilisin family serine protease
MFWEVYSSISLHMNNIEEWENHFIIWGQKIKMDDQKIENLLNLALDATQEEREKSESLEVGYDSESRRWQVIVRYHGDLGTVALPGWDITMLTGGYAIVTLPQSELSYLAALPQVEYIEKPKRLYFSVDRGRAASCVSALQTEEYDFFGQGVLIAVIDSGVDYLHPDFRNDDGSTRILAIWDQSASVRSNMEEKEQMGVSRDTSQSESLMTSENTEASPEGLKNLEAQRISENQRKSSEVSYLPPEGFTQGIEYTREMIDLALTQNSRAASLQIVPEQDTSGHGTHVLGIAAGNGRASGGRYRGVAPQADIIVVKLGTPQEGGFPRTTEVMQAVEYVIRKARDLEQPVAINLSFGNVYGSHRGTSLLETYLTMMADQWKNVIVVGMGNEGNGDGHSAGTLRDTSPSGQGNTFSRTIPPVTGTQNITELLPLDSTESQRVEFSIGSFETTMNLQIWKNYVDEFQIYLIHPDGSRIGPLGRENGTARYRLGTTELLVYYGQPSPYQGLQEIYIDFLPADTYVDSGIWQLVLVPQRIVSGEYEIWMPDSRIRNSQTHFLRPVPDTTLTIPATASRVISVAAYDAHRMTYASFSGRGWETEPYYNKPDLAAPGVDINSTAPGGGYSSVTGTSFATPFVTGAAALLMQWGIVEGRDPYMYGEKLRVSLNRGARQLTAETQYPNPRIGYGEDVIIRSHSRKPVKSSVSTRFPRTEKEHFNRYFEENLPGLDSKCWCGCDL